MDFYTDESSQTGHRYFVIGSICASTATIPKIVQRISELRTETCHFNEMKWTYLNKYNVHAYEAWIDYFFRLCGNRHVMLQAMVVDASKFDHKKYNEGDKELGFNKMLYQHLLHQLGRNYGFMRPLYGYLDHRTTVHTPERLRSMLNAGLNKIHPTKYKFPFRRLVFRKSEETVLLQIVDIIIGAIAFDRNKRGIRPEKIRLAASIKERMQVKPAKWRCKVWDFVFGKKDEGP